MNTQLVNANSQHAHPSTQPAPPAEYVRRMEKEIVREGRVEEKNLKHAIKDLSHLEKSETKAAKIADKAEHTLHKSEKKEQSTLNALNKATNKHDVAAANLHSAEQEAQVRQKQHEKLQADLERKKAVVDNAIKSHEAHVKEREAKLGSLHGDRPVVPGHPAAPIN
ncbi:hypothetical protein BDQ12DRAFT_722875 [Crucibulum laeve]|uniref:Uncharacterized protein n=1 Tax=Crucibulum laeve TaxID=68775 RepID=A0A5C3M0T2_9AGAR|nr:hypothetical protein BDQ12DRAFT_722875 [Crucibulum laeve]